MPGILRFSTLLALTVVLMYGQNLAAPPWVRPGSIVNAASHLPVNLPGGALAPGARIVIDGLRFEPARIAVEIEISGKVYPATILKAATEHILARMPTVIPTGDARLFVLSHGKRSAGSDIAVAASAFGIYTANGQGWGTAAMSEPIGHPGKPVTLSGTGLGRAAPSAIEVFVGGTKASHVERSSSNGTDRLRFVLPAGTPESCAVPIIVTAGSSTSNTATLPVGTGAECRPSPNWFEQMRSPGLRSGSLVLLRSDVILELTPGKPTPFMLDNLIAGFARRLAPKQTGHLDLAPPPGSCLSWAGPMDSNQLVLPSLFGAGGGGDSAYEAVSLEDLDAGSSLTITGPNGIRQALRAAKNPRLYSLILGGNPPLSRIPPTPLFLSPGTYRIDLPGGADIGVGSAALDVSTVIIWRNRESTGTLDRRTGLDLKWTLPEGYTAVAFAFNISRRNSSAGFAVCLPPVKATEFRIPANALANLPPTIVNGSDLSLGFVGVAALPIEPSSFQAKGLDRAFAAFLSMSGRSVIVK